MHPHHVLVTVTGFDRPGVTSALFAALAAHDVEVVDVEQVVVRGRLVLSVALTLHGDPAALRRAATHAAEALGVEVGVSPAPGLEDTAAPDRTRHRVVVLGRPLRAGAVALVARRVADLGGNIEATARIATTPMTALELTVAGTDHSQLCQALASAAGETGTDIAVERCERQRLAKRLLLIDVDRTVLRGDVFDLLAEMARVPGAPSGRAGDGAVATGWPGAADTAEALRARAARLAGLPAAALDEVGRRVWVDPDLGPLVAALGRFGYRCGAVSSAPAQVVEPLLDGAGLDLVAANRLEVAGGALTGRLLGGLVDRLGKARAMLRFAEAYGVPSSQTVAVAAAGEVELMALAGLGVALHAASSGPLDGLLLLLGLTRDDVPGAADPLLARGS
jgi:phosphoserine phosphatase